MTNKLVCLVGLPGSGKSAVSEYLLKKRKFGYFRFGQITLDIVKRMRKKPSEDLEKKIREDLRKKYGMAAFAILNLKKINKLRKIGDVIGDGLYSWEEYLYLKEKFNNNLIVIAVYAPPFLRYDRLKGRGKKHGDDPHLRFRSFSKNEAKKRDEAQIENLHQAGPIAMADYTLLNASSFQNLYCQIDQILKKIYVKKNKNKIGKAY